MIFFSRTRRRKLTTLAIAKAMKLSATQSYALLRARIECLPHASTHYATEKDNNRCIKCKKGPQSTPHLLGQCEKLKCLRKEIFGVEEVSLASAVRWVEERIPEVLGFLKRAEIFDDRTVEALGTAPLPTDFNDEALISILRRVGEYNRMNAEDVEDFEDEMKRRMTIVEEEAMYN